VAERSVVDTGVIVSALAFGGTPRAALLELIRRSVLFVSPALLDEYRAVPGELLAARKITQEQWRVLLAGTGAFVSSARTVMPAVRVRVCRDPGDDMLLECCFSARADILLTGDRDLLDLDRDLLDAAGLGSLRIVTPRAYLASTRR
jgi:putative PIN family toxin of toxin-antitoxin system